MAYSLQIISEPAKVVPNPSPAPVVQPSVAGTQAAPLAPSSKGKEPFADWIILGFIFTLTLVILFLFLGTIDVNLTYSMKFFFQYIVLGLTVAMLIAGVIEWVVFKKRLVGYFSIGMVSCIVVFMAIIAASAFIPELLPVSNAILASDGPYSKEDALAEFSRMTIIYSQQANGTEPGSAISALYTEIGVVGVGDMEFFSGLADIAAIGSSGGEQLFALVIASEASPSSLSAGVSRMGSIDSSMAGAQLMASIGSNTALVELMRAAVDSNFAVDEAKLGGPREELEGKYPAEFWQNSRGFYADYLSKFIDFKKNSLQESLDAGNFVAALIEYHQLNALISAFGK